MRLGGPQSWHVGFGKKTNLYPGSHVNGKSKLVSVYGMESYRGSRGIAPPIPNLSFRWR
jgi:hypothetical protein